MLNSARNEARCASLRCSFDSMVSIISFCQTKAVMAQRARDNAKVPTHLIPCGGIALSTYLLVVTGEPCFFLLERGKLFFIQPESNVGR